MIQINGMKEMDRGQNRMTEIESAPGAVRQKMILRMRFFLITHAQKATKASKITSTTYRKHSSLNTSPLIRFVMVQ